MTLAAEMAADIGDTVSICSLRVGTGLYGIATSQIREVLGTIVPQSVPLAPEYIAGVVPYRGKDSRTNRDNGVVPASRGSSAFGVAGPLAGAGGERRPRAC